MNNRFGYNYFFFIWNCVADNVYYFFVILGVFEEVLGGEYLSEVEMFFREKYFRRNEMEIFWSLFIVVGYFVDFIGMNY